MPMPRVIFASTRDSDMHYAVKTPITSSFFYLEIGNRKLALLDKRDFGLLRFILRPNLRIKEIALEPLFEKAGKLKHKTSDRNKLAYLIFKKYGLMGRKVQVPIHFPLDMADFLRARGAKLVPTFPFFPERARKTKEEISCIEENLTHTKLAFRTIENILRRSKIKKNRIYYQNKIITSEFLKQEVEKALVEKGMFDMLGMIISSGEQTAIPHHIGTGPIRPHQPIVCDIFPRHRQSGYFSDMTRTYVKGNPSEKIMRMYKAVLKAQLAAMKKIPVSPAGGRAGVRAKEIYEAAASVIIKSGFDVGEIGLTHGLGHGVGLDIHEKPSLKPLSEDILEAGNIITVEPGLYYPGIGGVRIEDMILVTKTGFKNLTNYPKKLIIP
ncbi:MAG: M24 family metallopeptidase [Patescibacteria group bacterium]|nr:M24 family metallopeptidase [Patescibacteria group bacterium]